MTVANSSNKITYTGNGTTTQFPFSFRIFEATDIQVILTDVATGTDTTLSTNYAVDTSSSYVTYPVSGEPLTSSTKITISRAVPITQETSLPNQGAYYAKSVENALDKITIIGQQLQDNYSRALKHSVSVDTDEVSTELPAPVPLNSFRWNSTGTGLELTLDPATVLNAATSAGQAAQTAQAAAETAQSGAVSAKNDAQTAAINAANSASTAATAGATAGAATGAEAAQPYATAAENSASLSLSYKTAAETAAGNAATSEEAAALNANCIFFDTKAEMDADLAHAVGTRARVRKDSTASNNTYYKKLGDSGSGSWEADANLYVPPGTVGETELADGATTPAKTSFITQQTGKNLFNPANLLNDGSYVLKYTVEGVTDTTKCKLDPQSLFDTYYLAVSAGKTYTITIADSTHMYGCLFNDTDAKLAAIKAATTSISYSVIDGSYFDSTTGTNFKEHVVTPTADCTLFVTVFKTEAHLMIREGTDKSSYEPYAISDILSSGINLQDFSVLEQAYIRNCELTCNLNAINYANTAAKYTFADMEENAKTVKCKCKFHGNATVALIATAIGKRKVTDITHGAVHLAFTPTTCYIDVFNPDGSSTSMFHQEYTYSVDATGATECELGWSFDASTNTLTVYLPDGTTQTLTNTYFAQAIGRYVCWEHYIPNITTADKRYPVFTYFYAEGITSASNFLIDDFKRLDGSIGIAPTGQVYSQFRNNLP